MLTPDGKHQNYNDIHPVGGMQFEFLMDYGGIMLYRKKEKDLPKQSR